MKENKKKNIIIIVLSVIVVMLVAFVVLILTNTINVKIGDNTNKNNEVKNNNEIDDGDNNEDLPSSKNDDNIVAYTTDSKEIVNDTIKKAFAYIHSLSPYCGDRKTDDYITEGYQRWEASSFSNKDELDNYLKTFMSDNMISKYSRNGASLYKEQDGKLYCLNSNKDCGMYYNEDETSYHIIYSSDDSIDAIGTIASDSCGGTSYLTVSVELEKNSNEDWVLEDYFEIETGTTNTSIVKDYLLDKIIYYNKNHVSRPITVVYLEEKFTSENDIENLKDNITAPYVSPNGEKWNSITLGYYKNGYLSTVNIR